MKFLASNNEDFKIIQFTDLHLGKHKYFPENSDTMILEDVIAMINSEKPQLVVFTGDTIDGESCDDAKSVFRNSLKKIDQLEIPWALVFGNHDETGNASKEDLMEVLSTYQYCLSESGPADVRGIGNFHVAIKDVRKPYPAFSLYFLDYGSNNRDYKYDRICENQIQWFKQINAECQKTPAFMFFHIPLEEFNQTEELFQGEQLEGVDSSSYTTNFFDEIVNAKNIIAVFCGHDHYNNYCTRYKGINLCYGQGSGFDFYSSKLPRKRGARIININLNSRETLDTEILSFPTDLE